MTHLHAWESLRGPLRPEGHNVVCLRCRARAWLNADGSAVATMDTPSRLLGQAMRDRAGRVVGYRVKPCPGPSSQAGTVE